MLYAHISCVYVVYILHTFHVILHTFHDISRHVAHVSCLHISCVYVVNILHTSHVILHTSHVYMLCIYSTHFMLINCIHLAGSIAHIMLYSKKKKLHTSRGMYCTHFMCIHCYIARISLGIAFIFHTSHVDILFVYCTHVNFFFQVHTCPQGMVCTVCKIKK